MGRILREVKEVIMYKRAQDTEKIISDFKIYKNKLLVDLVKT